MPKQVLFRIIGLKRSSRRGGSRRQPNITLAKKCCLSLNEVKVLVIHLEKKKENCAKAEY